jgi:hypothetical protein
MISVPSLVSGDCELSGQWPSHAGNASTNVLTVLGKEAAEDFEPALRGVAFETAKRAVIGGHVDGLTHHRQFAKEVGGPSIGATLSPNVKDGFLETLQLPVDELASLGQHPGTIMKLSKTDF